MAANLVTPEAAFDQFIFHFTPTYDADVFVCISKGAQIGILTYEKMCISVNRTGQIDSIFEISLGNTRSLRNAPSSIAQRIS